MINKTTLSQFPLLTDFEKQWAFKESKKEPNVSCDTLPLNLPFPNPLPKHSLSTAENQSPKVISIRYENRLQND